MAIDDPQVKSVMGELRVISERSTALMQLLDEILFLYDDRAKPILEEADDADEIDEGRDDEGIPRRTVAQVKDLVKHMELLNLAGKGSGIGGIQDLQAKSNELGDNFAPLNNRRRFHVRSRFGLE